MIVSSDGKLSGAAVRRQLDFPSVMRKPNPTDVVFKAKFDTQNPIIGMLLTQIEAGKSNQEKQIKKTETAPYKGFENCRAIKMIERF